MQIPILIEPIAGNGYRASGGEPLALTADGATHEEALANTAARLPGPERRFQSVTLAHQFGEGVVPAAETTRSASARTRGSSVAGSSVSAATSLAGAGWVEAANWLGSNMGSADCTMYVLPFEFGRLVPTMSVALSGS